MGSVDRRSGRASGDPAGEDAAAEEGALERVVAVHPAAAEAGDLARGVDTRERLARGLEHAGVEVGVQAAEGLARQDVQPDGDQRAVGGVEELVRRGDPDQLVAAVVAVPADEGDLGVLGVGVVQLPVALGERAAQRLLVDQRRRR